VSDLLGTSARRKLQALADGNTEPQVKKLAGAANGLIPAYSS
jgi:hypothetical protein